MAKLRKAALWVFAAAVVVFLLLWGAGALGPVYRWMVRCMQPAVWEAMGTWATAAVAIVTVLVAGRYAKQQVDEVRRTREEQAQPNVVLYSEPNANSPNIHEIVLKNFGTTPAYDVRVDVTPPIRSTLNPEHEGLGLVAIPNFPILAPGQEWRTIWDSATRRKSYLRRLPQLAVVDAVTVNADRYQSVDLRVETLAFSTHAGIAEQLARRFEGSHEY